MSLTNYDKLFNEKNTVGLLYWDTMFLCFGSLQTAAEVRSITDFQSTANMCNHLPTRPPIEIAGGCSRQEGDEESNALNYVIPSGKVPNCNWQLAPS